MKQLIDLIEELKNKILNLMKWSRITNPGSDQEDHPVAQIEYLDRVARTTIVWQYGTGGVAPTDSLCLTISVGADESNRVSIATAPDKRKKGLKPGETFFGNPLTGSLLFFLEDGKLNAIIKGDMDLTVDGNINITSPNDINITAPNVIINGNMEITGDLIGQGSVDLGGVGGRPIARFGDTVSGGVITSGSPNSSTN